MEFTLRKKVKQNDNSVMTQRILAVTEQIRRENKAILMDTLYRCCSNQDIEDLSDPSSTSPSNANSKKPPKLSPGKTATHNLSQLLVELVSPDVLQNGPLWPEEETVRHTVERDLLIKKRLEDHRIIIDILDLIAKGGFLDRADDMTDKCIVTRELGLAQTLLLCSMPCCWSPG
jgi:hypothetical protein